jgi:CubicO group peptidase (beta-lactamase class C family)
MNRLIVVIVLAIAAEGGGATLSTKIDAYVAPYVKYHAFSGVILLAHKDEVLVNRPYGMANYEFNVPVTIDTRFRIASITKRFTHIIVTRLIEDKELSGDDPLAKFYPSFPKADKITIDQLIDHRSGIRDPEKLRRVIPSSYTPADVIDLLAQEPLGSEPGAVSVYTTANYAVLAYVIEQVTGKPFPDVMREMIFAPAGMTDSGELSTTTVIPRLASGYMPDPYSDGFSVCGPEDTSWKAGGGSSYSTSRDLHRFARAWYGGKLLKTSALDLIAHKKMFDKRYSESSGAFPGANANLTYFPDDELTVVVLSNNYSPIAGTIGRDVAAMYFNQPYKVPEITPHPAALDPRVTGTWSLEGYPNFTVTVRNGRNVLVWTSARQEALIPLGNDEYFAPLDFAKVKFTFDETPHATWDAVWSDHVLKVTRVGK